MLGGMCKLIFAYRGNTDNLPQGRDCFAEPLSPTLKTHLSSVGAVPRGGSVFNESLLATLRELISKKRTPFDQSDQDGTRRISECGDSCLSTEWLWRTSARFPTSGRKCNSAIQNSCPAFYFFLVTR
jgi:hypothetical protein